jgi:hypothetical protein
MYVILIAHTGQLVGPFDSLEEANEYAEHRLERYETTVVPLIKPDR